MWRVYVCVSSDSQGTGFSCHTTPDRYIVCAVYLLITRIPPTETSEDAADSEQQMGEAFFICLLFIHSRMAWWGVLSVT